MDVFFVFEKPTTAFGSVLSIGNVFRRRRAPASERFCHVHVVIRSLDDDEHKGRLLLFAAYKNTPFDMYYPTKEDAGENYVWVRIEPPNEDAYREATAFMRNQCGKSYNYAAYANCAIGKVVTERFPADSWFCSQITTEVAKRYLGFTDCTLDANKVHPTDLFAYVKTHTRCSVIGKMDPALLAIDDGDGKKESA